MVWCGVEWHGRMVWCVEVRCGGVWCGVVWCVVCGVVFSGGDGDDYGGGRHSVHGDGDDGVADAVAWSGVL